MSIKSAMQTIGLLGGMSWESTRIYYRELNQRINQQLGGLHSAQMVMINVDFAPIEQLMQQGQWSTIGDLLTAHCTKLEQAGADFLVIATNTMHKLAPQIESQLSIPLLHIADVVGRSLQAQGVTTVGLLGTGFTMAEDFYKNRLQENFAIDTLVPNQQDRDLVDRVVFTELCHGVIKPESKQAYLKIMDQLAAQGAQAIILGCTEICLLVQPTDTEIPLLDATEAHIQAAVDQALNTRQ